MISPQVTTKPYIPEEYTHLFHTPVYKALNRDERLRYNQLYSLRINEQFFTFEELFIQKITQRLCDHRAFRCEAELRKSIVELQHEEAQHSRMFRSFNLRSRPDIYTECDTCFARLGRIEKKLLDVLVGLPGLNPALMFLMLALEELTTAISTAILDHPDVLDLDPDYVDLHRRHLADEKRHVGIDVKALKQVMAYAPACLQPINAAVFRRLLMTILKPQRSTLRVIRQLVSESGRLAGLERYMVAAVKSLDKNSAFPAGLVQPSLMPVMHSMFEQYGGYTIYHKAISGSNETAPGPGI